ncbi:uncharacterized protein EAE98_002594 [Botrytis deweyae]|uniref:Uncharacterized protein n=1 Tax=Botrytis deweyae TaxID=2478750 RepID=A0ABQ7IXL8_9HELO|nr:uncharacterized protein EAE98_002594 [Botrytis deweyae]KAF7936375.1 hypothetical protein EAE98_002594 [Botrytis deweyae]
MSTEVAEPPLWCHSESAYLNSITMHTADGKEVTINPRAAMYQMTIEQVKHHLGGVAFAQDPWPIREYTSQSIEEQWRHIQEARVAAEIARKEAKLEREVGIKARREARKAAKIAREAANHLAAEEAAQKIQNENPFILPFMLFSLAPDDTDIEMPLEWQQEVEEMMAPLKQKWAEEDRAKAAQYQSAITAADQVLGADFWTQCEEDVDME